MTELKKLHSDFFSLINKNHTKEEIIIDLMNVFIYDSSPLFQRENEIENIGALEEFDGCLTLCGKVIPPEIVEAIFKYVPKNYDAICKVGRICKQIYISLLQNWDRIVIEEYNIQTISLLALQNVQEIVIKDILSKKTLFHLFSTVKAGKLKMIAIRCGYEKPKEKRKKIIESWEIFPKILLESLKEFERIRENIKILDILPLNQRFFKFVNYFKNIHEIRNICHFSKSFFAKLSLLEKLQKVTIRYNNIQPSLFLDDFCKIRFEKVSHLSFTLVHWPEFREVFIFGFLHRVFPNITNLSLSSNLFKNYWDEAGTHEVRKECDLFSLLGNFKNLKVFEFYDNWRLKIPSYIEDKSIRKGNPFPLMHTNGLSLEKIVIISDQSMPHVFDSKIDINLEVLMSNGFFYENDFSEEIIIWGIPLGKRTNHYERSKDLEDCKNEANAITTLIDNIKRGDFDNKKLVKLGLWTRNPWNKCDYEDDRTVIECKTKKTIVWDKSIVIWKVRYVGYSKIQKYNQFLLSNDEDISTLYFNNKKDIMMIVFLLFLRDVVPTLLNHKIDLRDFFESHQTIIDGKPTLSWNKLKRVVKKKKSVFDEVGVTFRLETIEWSNADEFYIFLEYEK